MLIICRIDFCSPPSSCNRKPNYHLDSRRVIRITYLKCYTTSKLHAVFIVLVRLSEESPWEKTMPCKDKLQID